MFGRTASAYVLLALSLTAAAAPAPAEEATIWDEYANFYDDKDCSDNSGIGVALNNDGCLNERESGKDSPSPDIAVRFGLIITYRLDSEPGLGTPPGLPAFAHCFDLVDVHLR